MAQHFENIEIIIVNDGSPDNSQQIIDEYVKKYPEKVKSLIKENGGLGSARNFGLDYAQGEYIGFIDSDDYARPDMFEKLYARAKAEHADLVICNMDMVDEDEKLLASTDISARNGSGLNEKQYALKYGRTEAFNKLYHRDLFMKTGIRYPAGWFEDYATTPLLIEAAGKIAYVPDSLMCYVQRKGSIMDQAGQFSDKYFDILKMTEILVNNKHRFNPEDYDFFMDNIAPVHAFLKYYLSILSITDKMKRNYVIAQWGDEINRLLPGWEKSTAVKNQLKRKNSIKRIAVYMAMFSFQYNMSFLASLVHFMSSKLQRSQPKKKNHVYE
jgi:hypothetical protein